MASILDLAAVNRVSRAARRVRKVLRARLETMGSCCKRDNVSLVLSSKGMEVAVQTLPVQASRRCENRFEVMEFSSKSKRATMAMWKVEMAAAVHEKAKKDLTAVAKMDVLICSLPQYS